MAGRFLRDAFMEITAARQSATSGSAGKAPLRCLGMSDLKILVKKAFDRGFIDSHVLGFDHFEEDLRRGSSILANHGVQMIATTRYSAIPSKSYPDGTASPSNTARTRSDGGDRQRLIMPAANALKIRSKASGETIHVLAAVGRNSRSAALLTVRVGSISPELTPAGQGRHAPG